MIAPHHWLALCLLTESNKDHEWPYVAMVIRNRVVSPRYPDTIEAVVLQKYQFSAFNFYTARKNYRPEEIFTAVGKGLIVKGHYSPDALMEACDSAARLMDGPQLFDVDVLHYYSPISMNPPGSAPAWAKTAKRLFTPAGIDPKRFIFAEGVA